MRIAVLSDTHMQAPDPVLEEIFENRLSRMEYVLHCGDFTGEAVYAYLNSHPGFFAVRGNMDQAPWAADLPLKRVLRIGGSHIGLLHGFGFGDWRHYAGAVFEPGLDLVCFGHTHQRLWKERPGQPPVLNPGSFSLPRRERAGYAVLTLEKGKVLSPPRWELLSPA